MMILINIPFDNSDSMNRQGFSSRSRVAENDSFHTCLASCDHVTRSWPLFRAKAMPSDLIAGRGSPAINRIRSSLQYEFTHPFASPNYAKNPPGDQGVQSILLRSYWNRGGSLFRKCGSNRTEAI